MSITETERRITAKQDGRKLYSHDRNKELVKASDIRVGDILVSHSVMNNWKYDGTVIAIEKSGSPYSETHIGFVSIHPDRVSDDFWMVSKDAQVLIQSRFDAQFDGF